MKTRLLLWMALLLPLTAMGAITADQSGRSFSREMAVNADVQAGFYQRFPNLDTEQEVVAMAARELAIEGAEPTDAAKAAELLAARSREILSRRTPQEWQRKAVSLYPELGVAGSEFNALFLRHYKELEQSSPQFMEEPSWPVLLAKRCADELQPKPASATSGKTIKGTPVSPSTATAAEAPKKRNHVGWVSALSLALLVVIVVAPARFLFSCRNAFAGSDGPSVLWQRALGPTAWAYLAVALLALVRTFTMNVDQKPVDRFGITLLVSLVSGVVFAIPAYGVALVSIWWSQRRTPPLPQPVGEPPTSAPAQASERRA